MRALPAAFRPYTWAPPSDEVARIAGIDRSQVVRYDQNTPPLPLRSSRPGALAATLAKLSPDILFSFYYRKMLPESILRLAPQGGLNLHGSLLPRYRGRSPVNWVLVNGETETGVTLHYMDAKPDHGDVVAGLHRHQVPVDRRQCGPADDRADRRDRRRANGRHGRGRI